MHCNEDNLNMQQMLKYHEQFLELCVKLNHFKKQSSSSSFLLTEGNNTGPKWQWSTQQASSMS